MLKNEFAQVLSQVGKKPSDSRWGWPWGLLATGLAGAAVFLFRGCWHSKMSWPVRSQEISYQVCLGCGIKRLFDEKTFRAYGPFSYDLATLNAYSRSQQRQVEPGVPSVTRSAS